QLLRSREESVVFGTEGVPPARPCREDDAAEPLLATTPHLTNRLVYADVRNLGEPKEALRIVGTKLSGQPVVVGAYARPVEVHVGVSHEVIHGALARVEELGVHAVDVHVFEPRLPVPAALPDRVVGVPTPANVLVAHARGRHETDVHEGLAGTEGPGIATLLVLDESRRPVVELRR